MRECSGCDWMKGLEDSEGNMIYFCMNCDSGAYCNETGICGNCDLDDDEEADHE